MHDGRMASRLCAHVKKYTLPKIRYLKVETTVLDVKNEIYVNFHPSETFFWACTTRCDRDNEHYLYFSEIIWNRRNRNIPTESTLLKFIFEFSIKNYPTLCKIIFHEHIRKLWNLQKRQKCVVKLVQFWLGALSSRIELTSKSDLGTLIG